MNIYENIYNLINTYVFNNSIVTGTYEELVTILYSTGATFLLVSLPFVVIIAIITLVIKWRW